MAHYHVVSTNVPGCLDGDTTTFANKKDARADLVRIKNEWIDLNDGGATEYFVAVGTAAEDCIVIGDKKNRNFLGAVIEIETCRNPQCEID